MKILLTAINAKYIHSNLAIYSLRSYAKAYRQQIQLAEFTINNYTDDILQAIYKEKPDFIGFSCYIWNIGLVDQLCIELKKLLPECKIWLGGPEVSYDAEKRLEESTAADGIMIGEGEETFLELMDYYIAGLKTLEQIKGIAFTDNARKTEERNKSLDCAAKRVNTTGIRTETDISSIPFPYEKIEDFKNKIIYYEASRGCPYSCSYCLSSIDKKVRLREIELVKKELGLFLQHKVPQVKFVDRTFNCNKKQTLAIWHYIKEQDNGITNFHFEISADILDEEELELLSTMRPGLVQLEIGVQSTNPKTIEAISRKMNLDKLKQAVHRIHQSRNIHEHLDLIAGLPYEDMKTFQNSFNEVYAMKPDQFQLGFLKVLKGSAMFYESKDWGIVSKSIPPYEVLYTKWLSYDEILILKSVEDMVEIYYNSGQFEYAIKYMEHFFDTPFELYLKLGDYYERKKLKGINSSRMKKYEILLDFMSELKEMEDKLSEAINIMAFRNILVHDLYLRENLKSRPPFAEEYEPYKKIYKDFYCDEQRIRACLNPDSSEITIDRLRPYLHLEHYSIHVEQTAETGIPVKNEEFILYDYFHKNVLNSQARNISIKFT
ncbi:B12-binding domain-containing radical SAM protein [Anaerocolumna sp. MB42-C2]|uniref:B12-binding domain-containing radical SAM protein n=1 Tax=Anaerocolumna sp. MB42-C2 TaxID=3070997 RepID=UPI0027E1B34C|nr:B12-binding domain-containing radical SAM protein [Anaerocolumna sp. MB42-C2]WMJ90546.1 B12-binding domain-containing radical SAM protein [Anaerocolumna sp. MB42-C2]